MELPALIGMKINPAARKVIAEMFINEFPEDLATLNQAIETNDHEMIRYYAHKYQLRLRYLELIDVLVISNSLMESIDNGELESLHEDSLVMVERLHIAYKKIERESADS